LGIIVDAEGTRANRGEETAATETMIARVAGSEPKEARRRHRLRHWAPAEVAHRSTHRPHIPVWDKSRQTNGRFTRDDFAYDNERNVYLCPGGKPLTSTGNIDQGRILYYRPPKAIAQPAR